MDAKILRNYILYSLTFLFFYFGMLSPLNAAIPLHKKPYLTLAENEFIFNPRRLTWTAISNGRVIRSGHGSGGSNYCRDIRRSCHTPTGSFRVISKQGAGCKSSIYPVGRGGAPMPYCMFFTSKYAVHGSYGVRGYNASHGCIRIYPQDARWLYQNFFRVGTRVVVKPY